MVVTPISTILTAVTRDCDPVYGRCRCGLMYFPKFYKKCHTVLVEFCHSSWVTGSLAVWSRSHRQYWTVTDCDPSRSCQYGEDLTTPCLSKHHPELPWFKHTVLLAVQLVVNDLVVHCPLPLLLCSLEILPLHPSSLPPHSQIIFKHRCITATPPALLHSNNRVVSHGGVNQVEIVLPPGG